MKIINGDIIRRKITKRLGALCLVLVLVMSAFAAIPGYTLGTGGTRPLDQHEVQIEEQPYDGAEDVEIEGMNTTLEVNITYEEWDQMNVTFYDGQNDIIGSQQNYIEDKANVTWEDLEYGTEYEWYVNVTEADNEDENWTESQNWTFTTEDIEIELVEPADGAEDVSVEPTLSVMVHHPAGENMNVTFYGNQKDQTKIDLGNKSNVGDGDYANLTHSETGFDALGYDTEFEWYVTVTDVNGYSVKSQNWTFMTEDIEIELVAPAHEAEDVDWEPTLSVMVHHPEGLDMNVTFWNTTEEMDYEIDNDTVADREYANVTWQGLEYDTQYKWYVKVTDINNYSVESQNWTFTTEDINITDVQPEDGATGIEVYDNWQTNLSVTVEHPKTQEMNVTFFGNESGGDMEWLYNETVAHGDRLITPGEDLDTVLNTNGTST